MFLSFDLGPVFVFTVLLIMLSSFFSFFFLRNVLVGTLLDIVLNFSEHAVNNLLLRRRLLPLMTFKLVYKLLVEKVFLSEFSSFRFMMIFMSN